MALPKWLKGKLRSYGSRQPESHSTSSTMAWYSSSSSTDGARIVGPNDFWDQQCSACKKEPDCLDRILRSVRGRCPNLVRH